jgi:hypothetical protein
MKRRGAPLKPATKRGAVGVGIVLGAKLRGRLIKASRAADRTFAAECEHRLWRSLFVDDLVAARLADTILGGEP